MGTIARFFTYGVTMCIIQIVIGSLYKEEKDVEVDDTANYVLHVPNALKYTYMGFFYLGLPMFCLFLYQRVKGVPSVTDGHVWMSLGLMAIGIISRVLCNSWKIIVKGNEIEIHRIFRMKKVLSFSDIDKVEIGKKGQMILFSHGKKVVTIDALIVNYEYLEKSFKDLGML